MITDDCNNGADADDFPVPDRFVRRGSFGARSPRPTEAQARARTHVIG